MSAALGLFRLQQVDGRIGQLEARLRKIHETLENDETFQSALKRLKAAELDQRHWEQERRAAEEEGREQQVKIQQAEASLYGGKVQNPKELQDLQADVASLKKHLAAIEEKELEAMVQLEAAETVLAGAKEEVNKVQAKAGEENRQLLIDQEKLERELQDLQTERLAAVGPLEAVTVRKYEALREGHRGVAVVEISDNSCGGCGTTLTAALQQNARHASELVYCPSCGRILYAR